MRFTRLTIATLAATIASSGLGALAGTGSAAGAEPVAQYKVTLQISAKQAVADQDKIKLTGTVTPKPPEGSTVVLQAKYENQQSWKRVAKTTVKPTGTYKFVEKPGTHFDRVYRVVKATDDKATGDRSRERALSVTKWEWLTQMTTSAAEGFVGNATLPINGDLYPHTRYGLSTVPTGFAEFTLGRNCLTLEGTFGLSDRTETGGQATITVASDGEVAYTRSFDLGQSDAKSIDVSDVFRIRIDYSQVPMTPVTEPSIGAGRVLCD